MCDCGSPKFQDQKRRLGVKALAKNHFIEILRIPFHLSAFQTNMGATYVKKVGDAEAYEKYIGFCYDSQQEFLNSKTMDMTHRQIYEMFAKKALVPQSDLHKSRHL